MNSSYKLKFDKVIQEYKNRVILYYIRDRLIIVFK